MNNTNVALDNRSEIRRWIDTPFWRKVNSAVSSDWCGNDSSPLTDKTIHKWNICDKDYSICTFIDSGMEIGIGYGSEWHHIMMRREFNKIIISYIKIYIFTEWFGIRTWLYWYSLRKLYSKGSKLNNRPESTTRTT